MENFDNWNFNLRLYVKAYQSLGYSTEFRDWNVRYSPGRLTLDNLVSEASATVSVEDGILSFEVRPWNSFIRKAKSQNIDLRQINSGWRNSNFYPETSPSPEAVAFLEHLFLQGYFMKPLIEQESPYDDMDIPFY